MGPAYLSWSLILWLQFQFRQFRGHNSQFGRLSNLHFRPRFRDMRMRPTTPDLTPRRGANQPGRPRRRNLTANRLYVHRTSNQPPRNLPPIHHLRQPAAPADSTQAHRCNFPPIPATRMRPQKQRITPLFRALSRFHRFPLFHRTPRTTPRLDSDILAVSPYLKAGFWPSFDARSAAGWPTHPMRARAASNWGGTSPGPLRPARIA